MSEFFDKIKQMVGRRRTAYVTTFRGPVALIVLKDLAIFCRAAAPTFHTDARLHAVLEGRREVWLRIQNHLHLSDEDLFQLLKGD